MKYSMLLNVKGFFLSDLEKDRNRLYKEKGIGRITKTLV